MGEDGQKKDWWNPCGYDMRIRAITIPPSPLILEGGRPGRREVTVWVILTERGCGVAWQIKSAAGLRVEGHVLMTAEDLRAAFGLADAEAAKGEFYFRSGRFLNIPGPGTDGDGDLNISIFLTDAIKEAVRQLLAVVETNIT